MSSVRNSGLQRRLWGCQDKTPSGRTVGLTMGMETVRTWMRFFRTGSRQSVVVVGLGGW